MKSNTLKVSFFQDNLGEEKTFRFTTDLLRRLNKLGIEVSRNEIEQQNALSKGAPIDVNTLVITLISAGTINILIQVVKDWILRGENRHVKIRLESKKQTLELDYSPTAISQNDLEKFIKKLIKMTED